MTATSEPSEHQGGTGECAVRAGGAAIRATQCPASPAVYRHGPVPAQRLGLRRAGRPGVRRPPRTRGDTYALGAAGRRWGIRRTGIAAVRTAADGPAASRPRRVSHKSASDRSASPHNPPAQNSPICTKRQATNTSSTCAHGGGSMRGGGDRR